MKIVKIILLLLCLSCNILFSQRNDQRKLIAENKIKEKHTYKYIIDKGKPSGDSVLMVVNQYNSNGYSVSDMYFDTASHTHRLFKVVHEYLNDTILLKTVVNKSDNEINNISEYQYDASGNLVRIRYHWLSNHNKSPDSTITTMTYDSLNRKIAQYEDSGKGKKLIFRYEYDAKGNRIKWYTYFSKIKMPNFKLIEYDTRNRPIKYYNISGRKKRFAGTNTYNESGQLIEQFDIDRRVVKKYFGGYDLVFRKKDKLLTKNMYNKRGLLIQRDEYKNSKLTYRFVFKYPE